MKTMDDLKELRHGTAGICELRMDDPANGNRLTESLCRGLMDALDRLALDQTVKVLILSGRKDVFSGGAPLEALRKISFGIVHVKDLELPAKLLGFPLPILAAVEGHAVGGGLALAICCDISVAAENRRYGANFTDLGFTPGMGTTGLLPLLVGASFAAEMMITAKFYKGKELRGRSLFTHVVADEQVRQVTIDIAERMAEKPRHVLSMLKESLAAPRLAALKQALQREHEMHERCFADPATKEIIERNYIKSEGDKNGS
jgi:polyketide biosynthesis enoyl-CoA hydratase PksI